MVTDASYRRTEISWMCEGCDENVDKRYNLSISLSPVYSPLYISFAEADKSEACNVLADDACCRRQFARVSDVTLLSQSAKAGTLCCLSGGWGAHFRSIVLSDIVFSRILLLSQTLLCTNPCIIQLGISLSRDPMSCLFRRRVERSCQPRALISQRLFLVSESFRTCWVSLLLSSKKEVF